MSLPNILARLDSKIRPLLTILPSDLFASLYSSTSRWYADLASKDTHLQPIVVPSGLSRTISGLTFRSQYVMLLECINMQKVIINLIS